MVISIDPQVTLGSQRMGMLETGAYWEAVLKDGGLENRLLRRARESSLSTTGLAASAVSCHELG